MDTNLIFREYYPHPIRKVWAAVTDPVALSEWLMETDFVPWVGQKFVFRTISSRDKLHLIECQLLELNPPVRMVWSWQCEEVKVPTQLIFELEADEGGTNFTLKHTEDTGETADDLRKSGWPGDMTNLDAWLDMAL